jgi:hypothetical protein
MTYKTSGIRYCASVVFAGRTIQVNYNTPQELVKALRAMSSSVSEIRKVYQKGGKYNLDLNRFV